MDSSGPPRILAINVGSSSLKFALYDRHVSADSSVLGSVSQIGLPNAFWSIVGEGRTRSARTAIPDHMAAVDLVIQAMESRGPLGAIGHRVVHGGMTYGEPVRITPAVLDDLRKLVPLDPDHLPAQLAAIEALQARYPSIPHVACFDTAFHREMPRVAQLLPIPRRFEAEGARRYGFHGLSYQYLMTQLAVVAGSDAARGRVILAHLGSGASLAAVRDGKPVDTTMGFTPASGLVMGTRTGDIDPGLVRFLMGSGISTADDFDRMVNRESGLLGVSETTPDVQSLLAAELTDPRAAEALALFVYSVKKAIGAMAAALGGLDTLVFSGGIGEHSAAIRARICDSLGFLGITLDEARNAAGVRLSEASDRLRNPLTSLISTDTSPGAVRVFYTNEELMIARLTASFLG